MFRLGDSAPGDGQRSRFPGLAESQERRLRQVSLRSKFVDGHEHQLVSRISNFQGYNPEEFSRRKRVELLRIKYFPFFWLSLNILDTLK